MERAPSKAALLGARLVRLFSRPRRITTRVTRFHALLIRMSRGRIQRSWLFALGLPVMSITTIGRHSGKSRTTTVAYFYDHGELVTSAANLGNERDPAWALNLKANPRAEIVIEGRRHSARARLTEGEERSRLWSHWVELQPPAEAAQAVAGREIPVFVLQPVDGDASWVREQRHTTSRARPGGRRS
jgi:deazaflavin-dependent oxidoreductase (nitroreductase family)